MKLYVHAASFLLILLWVYTAASKLADFTAFRKEMNAQVFSGGISEILIFLLPALELLTALLLIIPKTIRTGFTVSALLLSAFTAYIILILIGHFPKVPCSCGGVLKQLDWWEHLWFNIGFLMLAVSGWFLSGPNRSLKPLQNPDARQT